MAFLVLSGNVELWQLYVLAVIFGVVDAFFYPALNTIVPMLVGERLLPPANALVQVMQQLSGLIGPAVAGLVIAAINTGPAFVIDAASFVSGHPFVCSSCGAAVGPAPSHEDGPREGVLANIGSGLSYAWRDPAVRAIVLLTTAFNFAFTGPVSVGLPYLAEERFERRSRRIRPDAVDVRRRVPWLAHCWPARCATCHGWACSVCSSAGAWASAWRSIGNVPSLLIVDAAIGAIGLGAGFINVRVIAWLQARTDAAIRGRVMSLVMLGERRAGAVQPGDRGRDHRLRRGHPPLLGGGRDRRRRGGWPASDAGVPAADVDAVAA